MHFRLGIENNNDDRTIAWALEHPGLFAYGRDSQEAQANFRLAARDYAAWIAAHGSAWLQPDAIELTVEETFDAYFIDLGFDLASVARTRIWSNPSFVRLESAYR